MSKAWKPTNWDDVCKRNAGRRKLHMRKRKERAERILRLLTYMIIDSDLRESSYGQLPEIAGELEISMATASRDLALCRRIHAQFVRMFGRPLILWPDQVVWSWNWSHYGFCTTETENAGYKRSAGKFPFATRETGFDEAAFCGLNPSSWETEAERADRIDLLVVRALAGM